MRRLMLVVIVFVAGLLIGFIPQYEKARHFEWQAAYCNGQLQLAQIRRAGTLTYLSATQLNYGTAAQYAKELFEEAQQLNSSSDTATRNMANDILSARDKITTDLAKGNAQVVSELQPLLAALEGAK
jgi:hypothetical protein